MAIGAIVLVPEMCRDVAAAPMATPVALPSPAAPESGEPSLAVAPDGTVWLSWLEKRVSGGHAFRAATLEGTPSSKGASSKRARWSKPITIAEGDSFFVNWADFPTLLPLSGGRLIAHWPWKSGADVYAYDVRIAQSADGGRTWSTPIVPHRDGTATEHGFVSMVPWDRGALAIWLDGRDFAYRKAKAAADSAKHGAGARHGEHESAGEMSLRAAVITPEGGLRDTALLDSRVCDCCQTAAVRVGDGVVVAYRDRDDHEIRDISVVHGVRGRDTGSWSEPSTLHADGWRIEGCPVNGPSIDATGERVAVAWYTAAQDTERVRIAFSGDEGRSFGPVVRVDEGQPLGRVDLVLLDDGSALVTWLEQAPEKAADLRIRRVRPNGVLDPATTIVRTSAARVSGFPRMVRSGKRLVFAWTDPGKPSQVRSAIATLE